MEVVMFPNARRPGVGLPPREESLRPMLPQHARNCPVLEAGSALGLLVYPPLEANEAFDIEFQGEGRYCFTFHMGSGATEWQPIARITVSLPLGGVGKTREEVEILARGLPLTPDAARSLMRMFIVPEDLGTPAGAVTLRGTTNFKTPEGWDTVYTSVINNIERPVAPILVVRVETDWYAHDSEFRYVLQPGETISGARNMPIGQVFFVPREPVTLRDCTDDELTAIRASKQEFAKAKAAVTQTTPHGLQYSPHYARQSRRRRFSLDSFKK
jgi:hypothetical protein